MKKQNKLARNAVRLRKAQNKRKDESNKPKPKQSRKRLISRIVALFGCLLLVSALVVPCFAVKPDIAGTRFEIEWELFTAVRSEDYNQLFQSSAYDTLLAYHASPSREFVAFGTAYEYLTGGTVNNGALPFDRFKTELIDAEGTAAEFTSKSDGITVSAFAKSSINQNTLLQIVGDGFTIQFVGIDFDADLPIMEVDFLYDDELIFSMLYHAINGVWTFRTMTIGESTYTLGSLSEFSICVASVNNQNVNFANSLALLFFGEAKVVYPKSEYSMALQVYERMYEEGLDIADDYYEAGLGDGSNDYEQGRLDGFKQGYDEAVAEIDSGEYGENLLGNMFSAPVKALDEVVIAALPDGTKITIMGALSAGVALSLFLAFLKKFAGG